MRLNKLHVAAAAITAVLFSVVLALASDTTVNTFDVKNQVYNAERLKDNGDSTYSRQVWLMGSAGVNAGVDASGTLRTGEVPLGTSITASATGGAQANNVTLAGTTGKTTYITGFEITGGGATSASIISVTVTGTITGTLNYSYPVASGATAASPSWFVEFQTPIPASAANTSIVVNVPSFGSGNTAASVTAHGFQL